jgi:hypothetical protein
MGFLEMLKLLMNGAKVPNWVKIVAVAIVLLIIYAGQKLAVGELADVQRDSTRQQIVAMRSMLYQLRQDNEDIRLDIREAAVMDSLRWVRTQRAVARLDDKVDDMNTRGTEWSNERIDRLYRMFRDMDKRRR